MQEGVFTLGELKEQIASYRKLKKKRQKSSPVMRKLERLVSVFEEKKFQDDTDVLPCIVRTVNATFLKKCEQKVIVDGQPLSDTEIAQFLLNFLSDKRQKKSPKTWKALEPIVNILVRQPAVVPVNRGAVSAPTPVSEPESKLVPKPEPKSVPPEVELVTWGGRSFVDDMSSDSKICSQPPAVAPVNRGEVSAPKPVESKPVPKPEPEPVPKPEPKSVPPEIELVTWGGRSFVDDMSFNFKIPEGKWPALSKKLCSPETSEKDKLEVYLRVVCMSDADAEKFISCLEDKTEQEKIIKMRAVSDRFSTSDSPQCFLVESTRQLDEQSRRLGFPSFFKSFLRSGQPKVDRLNIYIRFLRRAEDTWEGISYPREKFSFVVRILSLAASDPVLLEPRWGCTAEPKIIKCIKDRLQGVCKPVIKKQSKERLTPAAVLNRCIGFSRM